MRAPKCWSDENAELAREPGAAHRTVGIGRDKESTIRAVDSYWNRVGSRGSS